MQLRSGRSDFGLQLLARQHGAVGGTRHSSVDVAADEAAGDDDDGQKHDDARKLVELPGGVQQNQVGADQAGKDVEA